jgi:hypothetical protein
MTGVTKRLGKCPPLVGKNPTKNLLGTFSARRETSYPIKFDFLTYLFNAGIGLFEVF